MRGARGHNEGGARTRILAPRLLHVQLRAYPKFQTRDDPRVRHNGGEEPKVGEDVAHYQRDREDLCVIVDQAKVLNSILLSKDAYRYYREVCKNDWQVEKEEAEQGPLWLGAKDKPASAAVLGLPLIDRVVWEARPVSVLLLRRELDFILPLFLVLWNRR